MPQDAPFALRTPDLTLVALAPSAALDLASGGTGGFTWIEGGPEEGTRVGAGVMAKAAAEGAHRPGWGTYVLVRESDGLAVGAMGFHGPPSGGRVEIGYDVVAAARRNGYATQALRALTAWALESVGAVVARTEPTNRGSRRTLERVGFTRVPSPDAAWVAYELSACVG
ncbi:Acetyltransferase (GNAT) domain-containing protein [Streptomyces indicus]|uniref:Acetyltransferase (GNAT) domain-containing protein n=2 Tax=Streptomyces indicus TaxID=417292 RepID=A0A1G9HW08_9ACTN|nr:Acetyltransferase (GNAT) domain-containing protein [Streptomyces indicus]